MDPLPADVVAGLDRERLAAILDTLLPSERLRLDAALRNERPLWVPRKGSQRAAYDSPADICFYGGEAGGGKTDLAVGLSLTAHRRSLIMRRELGEAQAIEDRLREVDKDHGLRWNGQLHRLRTFDGRRVELSHAKNLGDEQKLRGRAHDLKAFDEICEFFKQQFLFVIGWLRSPVPDQRCRVLAMGNPPSDEDGRWVIDYWGPWLDRDHPNPALPGELRYYANLKTESGREEVAVPGPEPIEETGPDGKKVIITPMSRTFIPSYLHENPDYAGTAYEAVLQSLPEPLRSMLLNGDFTVALSDDPFQVIPRSWLEAAQARWSKNPPPIAMTSVGFDPARSGKAKSCAVARYGWWFGMPEMRDTHTTAEQLALVEEVRRGNDVPVGIDMDGGYGAGVHDELVERNVSVYGLSGSAIAEERAYGSNLVFMNARAAMWWALREALDPDVGADIAIPPSRSLTTALCAVRWRPTLRGIKLLPKEDVEARIGRSLDDADATVYALAVGGPPEHAASTDMPDMVDLQTSAGPWGDGAASGGQIAEGFGINDLESNDGWL